MVLIVCLSWLYLVCKLGFSSSHYWEKRHMINYSTKNPLINRRKIISEICKKITIIMLKSSDSVVRHSEWCLKDLVWQLSPFPKWEHGWLGWTPVHQVRDQKTWVWTLAVYLNVWLSNGYGYLYAMRALKKMESNYPLLKVCWLSGLLFFFNSLNRRWLVVWLYLCLYLHLTKL